MDPRTLTADKIPQWGTSLGLNGPDVTLLSSMSLTAILRGDMEDFRRRGLSHGAIEAIAREFQARGLTVIGSVSSNPAAGTSASAVPGRPVPGPAPITPALYQFRNPSIRSRVNSWSREAVSDWARRVLGLPQHAVANLLTAATNGAALLTVSPAALASTGLSPGLVDLIVTAVREDHWGVQSEFPASSSSTPITGGPTSRHSDDYYANPEVSWRDLPACPDLRNVAREWINTDLAKWAERVVGLSPGDAELVSLIDGAIFLSALETGNFEMLYELGLGSTDLDAIVAAGRGDKWWRPSPSSASVDTRATVSSATAAGGSAASSTSDSASGRTMFPSGSGLSHTAQVEKDRMFELTHGSPPASSVRTHPAVAAPAPVSAPAFEPAPTSTLADQTKAHVAAMAARASSEPGLASPVDTVPHTPSGVGVVLSTVDELRSLSAERVVTWLALRLGVDDAHLVDATGAELLDRVQTGQLSSFGLSVDDTKTINEAVTGLSGFQIAPISAASLAAAALGLASSNLNAATTAQPVPPQPPSHSTVSPQLAEALSNDVAALYSADAVFLATWSADHTAEWLTAIGLPEIDVATCHDGQGLTGELLATMTVEEINDLDLSPEGTALLQARVANQDFSTPFVIDDWAVDEVPVPVAQAAEWSAEQVAQWAENTVGVPSEVAKSLIDYGVSGSLFAALTFDDLVNDISLPPVLASAVVSAIAGQQFGCVVIPPELPPVPESPTHVDESGRLPSAESPVIPDVVPSPPTPPPVDEPEPFDPDRVTDAEMRQWSPQIVMKWALAQVGLTPETATILEANWLCGRFLTIIAKDMLIEFGLTDEDATRVLAVRQAGQWGKRDDYLPPVVVTPEPVIVPEPPIVPVVVPSPPPVPEPEVIVPPPPPRTFIDFTPEEVIQSLTTATFAVSIPDKLLFSRLDLGGRKLVEMPETEFEGLKFTAALKLKLRPLVKKERAKISA